MYDKIIAGRYRIGELLGQGGMARVYRAEDVNLGRVVAAKMLLEDIASDPEFKERFRREARAAAGLSAPNIVQVFDFFEAPEGTFIIMELIEGGTLRELIESQGRLSIDDALRICSDVLTALQVAHSKGVVHRDVSARNILLDRAGTVKVSDFGIAKVDGERTITQRGELVGSVQYIAPEQAKGEDSGCSADVYSTGVLLYQMLTGNLPFEAENAVQLALKHINEPAPLLSQKCPQASRALEKIVSRALDKDPSRRYATAAAMLEALDGLKCADDAEATVVRHNVLGDEMAQTLVRGSAFGLSGYGSANFHNEQVYNSMGDDDYQTITGRSAEDDVPVLDPSEYDEDYDDSDYSSPSAPATSFAATYGGGSAPADNPKIDVRYEEDGEKGGSGKHAVLWIGLLVLLFMGGGIFMASRFTAPRVEVPNLVGMSMADARKVLEECELRLEVQKHEMVEGKPMDSVLEQTPEAGASTPIGGVVYVTICGGQEKAIVPNVSGMSLERAEEELDKEGLLARVMYEPHEEVAKDVVFRQEPGAGESIMRGSSVIIVVSKGKGETTVPDLIGMDQKKAQELLEELGLEVKIVGTRASEDLPKGKVLAQDPESGSELSEGMLIKLTISSGAEAKVAAPDLVGMTVDEARQALAAYSPAISLEVKGDAVDTARIVSQSPSSGQPVSGSIAVKAFSMVAVPNVTGHNYDTAAQELRRCGLQVGSVKSVESSQPANVVLEQGVQSGLEVEYGSSVSLTVSAGASQVQPRPQEQPAKAAPQRVQESRPPVHQEQPAAPPMVLAPTQTPAPPVPEPPAAKQPPASGNPAENFPLPDGLQAEEI